MKTSVTTSGGEDTALARNPGTSASAAPVTDLLRGLGGTRRGIVPAQARISLTETTEVVVTGVEKKKNQHSFAESIYPPRSTAPVQPPAPSLPRPQHLAFPTVHYPAPNETAPEKSSTRLSEVLPRPSHREDVNRKCYASLDTKGLMKLPTIPFDIADGNSQMNLVNLLLPSRRL